jgi:F420-non-reducing hydrogenase large subunit
VITRANLIVATQNNAARIAMSVDKAAKGVIQGGQVDDGILNKVEMAFRAYDPCHGCATHALLGHSPLVVSIYDPDGHLLQEIRRES